MANIAGKLIKKQKNHIEILDYWNYQV